MPNRQVPHETAVNVPVWVTVVVVIEPLDTVDVDTTVEVVVLADELVTA
jgi:hypothetical protein